MEAQVNILRTYDNLLFVHEWMSRNLLVIREEDFRQERAVSLNQPNVSDIYFHSQTSLVYVGYNDGEMEILDLKQG